MPDHFCDLSRVKDATAGFETLLDDVFELAGGERGGNVGGVGLGGFFGVRGFEVCADGGGFEDGEGYYGFFFLTKKKWERKLGSERKEKGGFFMKKKEKEDEEEEEEEEKEEEEKEEEKAYYSNPDAFPSQQTPSIPQQQIYSHDRTHDPGTHIPPRARTC